MADVEHSALTTTDLHEPKGVAGATDDFVPAASSGAVVWRRILENSIDGSTGTVNQVMMTDGNANGAAWADESSTHHGELELLSNAVATVISVAGTFVEVGVNPTDVEHLSGVTHDTPGRLKVSEDGTYCINASVTFKSSTAGADDYSFDFGINGAGTLMGHRATRTTSSASDIGQIGLTTLHNLSADDEISIVCTNDTGTANLVIVHYTLTIYRVNRIAVA